MNTQQIEAFADEIFPEMVRFIEGEPTMEKVEAAFWSAMERRQKVAAHFLYDADFRAGISKLMFASAYSDVKRDEAFKEAMAA